jgi:hypothetical protein
MLLAFYKMVVSLIFFKQEFEEVSLGRPGSEQFTADAEYRKLDLFNTCRFQMARKLNIYALNWCHSVVRLIVDGRRPVKPHLGFHPLASDAASLIHLR